MPEHVETDSNSSPHFNDRAAVAEASEDKTDPALVALIRHVLDTSNVAPNSDGPGMKDGGGKDVMNRIGKFEVIREIGRGGSGTVLLVRDHDLGLDRALKVPNPATLNSTVALARFLDEARVASNLDHPNVVRIYAADTVGVIPYIVMEHCAGGSLAQWLNTRPRPDLVSQLWSVRLVIQLADAVQHAHDRGILHRDLKPSNILFQVPPKDSASRKTPEDWDRHDGEPRFIPKVTDFGLAKMHDATVSGLERTLQGVPLGTLPYMASEAARGDGSAIGPATDVYGLGIILFELLTGRRPFAALNETELLDQVLRAEPPSPCAIRHDLEHEVERVCLRCLSKDPLDRYQTPRELADALRQIVDGSRESPVSAPAKRAAPPRPRRLPRSTALMAGSAVFLAGLLLCVGYWLLPQTQRERADVMSPAERESDRPLLSQLDAADLGSLPALLPRVDPSDRLVNNHLTGRFAAGTPLQKLIAALLLARGRPEYADFCFDELLTCGPHEIQPLARLLNSRVSGLSSRLRAELDARPNSGPASEGRDHRRANAACALIAIGGGDEGWSLLRSSPNPQARSIVIHLLGPAGVDPRQLLDRISGAGDSSIRRALIQSLGELSEAAWTGDLRHHARTLLLDRYENDPDPGVHGSAKWMLLRWNFENDLRRIDGRLSESPNRPGFLWRVSPMGLTLVTISDPQTGRCFETSDTEVTVELFLKLHKDHKYLQSASPGSNYPVNSINYAIAAEFCNSLSEKEGIEPRELAYRPGGDLPFEPVEDLDSRKGYRLLTAPEFQRACRAGTTTIRYHGSSGALLPAYAWFGRPVDLLLHPVARRKPNDFGLFDMLGNADEICRVVELLDPKEQSCVCGGSVLYTEASIRCDQNRGPISVTESSPMIQAFGFRVARTLSTGR